MAKPLHYRHHRQRDDHRDRKTSLQVPSTSTRNVKEMQSPHTQKKKNPHTQKFNCLGETIKKGLS